MNAPNVKLLQKTFTQQQDEQDCGVACLLWLTKYYGGNTSFDNLRKLSGTNITGTTLLGLYQAANQCGFAADGCEADMAVLIEHDSPCILHVVIDEKINHYLICFGTNSQQGEPKFVMGDPAKGIAYYTQKELDKIWQSKACLILKPNNTFKIETAIKAEKKKWLLQLVKDDVTLLSISAALGIGIAVLGISMAIFSQRLIDDIIPKSNFLKLNLGIALLAMLLIIKEGLSVLRQLFLLRQSKDFNIRIIDFFYNHLLRLPKSFFDTRKIGELSARLNDTSRIQSVITQLAGNMIIDALVVIVSFVFIFIYSWQVGIICLCFMPVFYSLIYFKSTQVQAAQRAIMSSSAITESNYISTLQGIETIKNFNKENLYAASNNKLYNQYQDNIVAFGKIKISISFVANAFASLFLCGILWYSSYQVFNHHLKLGQLMALLSMCGSLLPSVANLALIFIPVNEAKIAFDRMFEFTGIDKEAIDAVETSAGKIILQSIEIKNLVFRFAGRSPIFKNISLSIRTGEGIAIIGDNGCGKSTLLQLLQKNYVPEAGNIIINKTLDLKNISIAGWRKLIGVVPQNISIFNATVIENIAFEEAATNTQKVLGFLQQYGFASFVDTLPQSYMTLVGEEGINLSGGQRQMIALARALYHQPQLLILDEATSAMDKDAEKFVMDLLTRLQPSMAIVFISHKLQQIQTLCDKVYTIEKGTSKIVQIADYVN